jgi:hypothetical protein
MDPIRQIFQGDRRSIRGDKDPLGEVISDHQVKKNLSQSFHIKQVNQVIALGEPERVPSDKFNQSLREADVTGPVNYRRAYNIGI